MLQSDELGKATEARFLELLSRTTVFTPWWFMGVEKAPPEWDARAVDFFLYFRPLDGSARVKVPVQVKSSSSGARWFRLKQSEIRQANILLLVVRSTTSDHDVRRMTYSALKRLRAKCARYDDFLAKELGTPLEPGAQGRVDAQKRNMNGPRH